MRYDRPKSTQTYKHTQQMSWLSGNVRLEVLHILASQPNFDYNPILFVIATAGRGGSWYWPSRDSATSLGL